MITIKTDVEVLIADDHIDLREQIRACLAARPCLNVRAVELATEGEANYAVLLIWDEEASGN